MIYYPYPFEDYSGGLEEARTAIRRGCKKAATSYAEEIKKVPPVEAPKIGQWLNIKTLKGVRVYDVHTKWGGGRLYGKLKPYFPYRNLLGRYYYGIKGSYTYKGQTQTVIYQPDRLLEDGTFKVVFNYLEEVDPMVPKSETVDTYDSITRVVSSAVKVTTPITLYVKPEELTDKTNWVLERFKQNDYRWSCISGISKEDLVLLEDLTFTDPISHFKKLQALANPKCSLADYNQIINIYKTAKFLEALGLMNNPERKDTFNQGTFDGLGSAGMWFNPLKSITDVTKATKDKEFEILKSIKTINYQITNNTSLERVLLDSWNYTEGSFTPTVSSTSAVSIIVDSTMPLGNTGSVYDRVDYHKKLRYELLRTICNWTELTRYLTTKDVKTERKTKPDIVAGTEYTTHDVLHVYSDDITTGTAVIDPSLYDTEGIKRWMNIKGYYSTVTGRFNADTEANGFVRDDTVTYDGFFPEFDSINMRNTFFKEQKITVVQPVYPSMEEVRDMCRRNEMGKFKDKNYKEETFKESKQEDIFPNLAEVQRNFNGYFDIWTEEIPQSAWGKFVDTVIAIVIVVVVVFISFWICGPACAMEAGVVTFASFAASVAAMSIALSVSAFIMAKSGLQSQAMIIMGFMQLMQPITIGVAIASIGASIVQNFTTSAIKSQISTFVAEFTKFMEHPVDYIINYAMANKITTADYAVKIASEIIAMDQRNQIKSLNNSLNSVVSENKAVRDQIAAIEDVELIKSPEAEQVVYWDPVLRTALTTDVDTDYSPTWSNIQKTSHLALMKDGTTTYLENFTNRTKFAV